MKPAPLVTVIHLHDLQASTLLEGPHHTVLVLHCLIMTDALKCSP